MGTRLPRRMVNAAFERLLHAEIDQVPEHVAVIQDGNRRYARLYGSAPTEGHREGADTTSALLQWCRDLGIKEITLYAFSTENFRRPADERDALFDLITEKLEELATSKDIHEHEVKICAIGDLDRLPNRVQEAIETAREATKGYDRYRLNIALAYGGRWELLQVAREICQDVESGTLDRTEIDVELIDDRLHHGPSRSVDLIIRTGGDERTSNFLPWHANGNEAAVYFCAPYWPEFSKVDFLRGIRTYQYRRRRWAQSRVDRARALVAVDRGLPVHRPERGMSGSVKRLYRWLATLW